LWGEAGELWDPRGRLPDYSYAGYHSGEEPIPDVSVAANLKTDFGAAGNGVTDDTNALKNAISSTNSGAILIPAGTYIISDRINIAKNNIVLRGEGSGTSGTILRFTKSLADVTGNTSPWCYGQGGMIWIGQIGGSAVGSKLASVTSGASRCDTTLTLSGTAGISAGQYVVLKMTDASDQSLMRHLHDDRVEPGTCNGQSIRWPVKVKSVSGSTIELEQPLRFDVRTNWGPGIYQYNPTKEVGVENIRIEFPDLQAASHLAEKGYNPLVFGGALNCWARNLIIKNADNGPDFNSVTKCCTVADVKHTAFSGRKHSSGHYGHHGFSFDTDAHDNMLTDFEINYYIHDVTVNHKASGNVIRNGIGENMCFDHHKDAPFANLFCNINIGTGSRPYSGSGNACAGPRSGAWETFWNITYNEVGKKLYLFTEFPTGNLVPGRTNITDTNTVVWSETIDNITPEDLYLSQLERRLGSSPASRVNRPVIQPNGGTFTSSVNITITCAAADAQITYTTDGSEPTQSSTLYTGPFTLLQNTTVKAKAFKSEFNDSYTVSASFTIEDTQNTQVPLNQLEEVKVYPNPYISSGSNPITFASSGATSKDVTIYTISGKLVKKLQIHAGGTKVDWDAVNEKGNKIKSGLYIYIIADSEGNKKTAKLVISNK
jgi:hypothetical protein